MIFYRSAALFLFLCFFLFGCGDNFSASKEFQVKQVIDGDTIELDNGESVRYIGIDTPETRKREGDTWVYVGEPFAEKAKDFNRRMVEGKVARLELDVQKKDKYGRLLAYCFVEDNFVNARMLQEGLALLYTIPPNIKYVDPLVKAQKEARENNRGLWAEIPVISVKEAGKYLNQVAIVEGKVSSIYQSAKVTILNFGRSDFKAVIFKNDLASFMAAGVSVSSYKGKTLRISGKVKEYKDKFEIIVSHPSSIEVVD
ncbi:MAG: thermonuclease family protein [Candidatus Omnitrophota bacterium]